MTEPSEIADKFNKQLAVIITADNKKLECKVFAKGKYRKIVKEIETDIMDQIKELIRVECD